MIEKFVQGEETVSEILKDIMMTEEEQELFRSKENDSEVTDLAWDQGEDHLMVSYANGQMGMVDFGGFEDGKIQWRIIYER